MFAIRKSLFYYTWFAIWLNISRAVVEKAKNNGDIYVVNEEKFLRDHLLQMQTEYVTTVLPERQSIAPSEDPNIIDMQEIVALCNSSFSIPMGRFFIHMSKLNINCNSGPFK